MAKIIFETSIYWTHFAWSFKMSKRFDSWAKKNLSSKQNVLFHGHRPDDGWVTSKYIVHKITIWMGNVSTYDCESQVYAA